jgi:hypothetical protein
MKSRNVVIGFAAAMLFAFAPGSAHAKAKKFTVVCIEKNNTTVDHTATGTECFASSDGTGKATAKAALGFADSELSSGGTTTATVRGSGAFSGATADTGGKSISHVAGAGGDGDATSDEKGTATTNVTGGGEAHTQAFGKCDANATADAGSFAKAVCEHNGTHATAVATNGGHAEGFDDKSPICTPNGGTAKVRSTGGNCGP